MANLALNQVPTAPPLRRRTATIAERGRADPGSDPSGHALLARAPPESLVSPGCWMFTNSVERSGVTTHPVISLPLGPVRNLLIEPVAELRGGFICRRGHPLVNKSKATLKIEDVLKYPIATTNLADEVIRLLQVHFGTKISFIQAIRLRSEDISSLIEAVRETDAVFFGVAAAARDGIADKSLIELSIQPPLDIRAPFGIVSLAGRSQSAAMGIVSSFIRDHLHD